MRSARWALGGLLLLAAAIGAPLIPGCKDSRSKTSANSVTYNQNIAPILWQHCASCHRPGEVGPFPLLTYDQAKKHATQIAKVTQSRFMPPWLPEPGHGEFADERRLSDAQIELIGQWIKAGCPEGQPTSAQPPTWTEGWQLGQPDLIAQMPAAYTLPAAGKDVYRNFVVPLPVNEMRWVRAVEFRVGNNVVHHAFILTDRSGAARRRDALDPELGYEGMEAGEDVLMPDGQLLSWQPGRLPSPGSDQRAWRLSKGTDMVLQMHMRPTGKPEDVQSRVGFYFAPRPPTQSQFLLVIRPPVIDIPAGEKNYVVESSYTLPVDLEVVGILPHAHYLGRELAGSAALPDGTSKPLILIRNWDFNWQSDYRYAKPMSLPRGTKLSMRYVFDNSEGNIHNPNHPPKIVRYGPNSTDEMAELWLQTVPKSQDDLRELAQDYLKNYMIPDAVLRSAGLLKYAPQDAEMRAKYGASLARAGRVEEGIAELRRAIGLDPKNAKTHYMMGVTLTGAGKIAEAMEEYENVLRLDAENYRAHNNLGLIYFSQGKLDSAARHFYNAVRINPNDVLSNMNLAKLFLAQGNLGQARLQLRAILEIDPENGFATEILRQVEAEIGKGR
ncbi:MAG TPA: tetratricopeptide repeat protein [Tepidisphaeraceae bacterium]|nr:tetratricopeptide repeat protein [Tepidisphaeraceae bacterium]